MNISSGKELPEGASHSWTKVYSRFQLKPQLHVTAAFLAPDTCTEKRPVHRGCEMAEITSRVTRNKVVLQNRTTAFRMMKNTTNPVTQDKLFLQFRYIPRKHE